MKKFNNNSDELDQHFLNNQEIINKVIEKCSLSKKDTVLEIGPGLGVLTKKIIPKVDKIYVIEKDTRLKKYLDNLNIDIIYDNCLNVQFPKVDKIITSLPYSIIEPFIYKIINENFEELYMIMGNTYVNNIINNKITNLSLLTNIYFDITKYFEITPENFNPKPRTTSSFIRLKFKEKYTKKELLFQNMYRLNEKKIKNALLESLININDITKKEAKEIINKYNIDNKILDKKFCMINNKELEILYNKIEIN